MARRCVCLLKELGCTRDVGRSRQNVKRADRKLLLLPPSWAVFPHKSVWLKLSEAQGFDEANQLIQSLCAHASGRNRHTAGPALKAIYQVVSEHLRLALWIYWVNAVLPKACFQRSKCCVVLCKANCLDVIPPPPLAWFHLRQTDGNMFDGCIRMAAVRCRSLSQKKRKRKRKCHLPLHTHCYQASE